MTILKQENQNVSYQNACSNLSCVISLRALFAGALTTIGTGFLFNLFNLGIGLSIVTYQNGNNDMGIAGFVWLIIAAFLSMFLSGYIAGITSLTSCKITGVLHGFLAWNLGLLILLAITVLALSNNNDYVKYIVSQPYISLLSPVTDNAGIINNNTETAGILGMFFIFLIGALSSCIGGYVGAAKNCKVTTKEMI